MVQNLAQLPNGATVNILDYAAVCTLDMSCAATLGIDVFETEGKDEIIRCLDAYVINTLLFKLKSGKIATFSVPLTFPPNECPTYFCTLTSSID